MSEALEAKRYLAVVQLGRNVTVQRIQKDVPAIMSLLKAHSSDSELAFRSPDGGLFGILYKSSTATGVVRSAFEASTATVGDDAILIVELGAGLNGYGFSRAWTWLQRH